MGPSHQLSHQGVFWSVTSTITLLSKVCPWSKCSVLGVVSTELIKVPPLSMLDTSELQRPL